MLREQERIVMVVSDFGGFCCVDFRVGGLLTFTECCVAAQPDPSSELVDVLNCLLDALISSGAV